jgi:hypothetical protein
MRCVDLADDGMDGMVVGSELGPTPVTPTLGGLHEAQ